LPAVDKNIAKTNDVKLLQH